MAKSRDARCAAAWTPIAWRTTASCCAMPSAWRGRPWSAARGDEARERASMAWVYGGVALLVLYLLIDAVVPPGAGGDAAERAIEITYMLAWYFAAARPQAKWVDQAYGSSFERKSWRRPLL